MLDAIHGRQEEEYAGFSVQQDLKAAEEGQGESCIYSGVHLSPTFPSKPSDNLN